ncbi:MAG TPA: polysaccharide biosynthesis/export family protein [Pyrinomonadaceae bacterium]|nr:polysaccharide biosynthesis/export family protein [Pyrinomonadaceae bacterium]
MQITKLTFAALLSTVLFNAAAYGQANKIAKIDVVQTVWNEDRVRMGESDHAIAFNYDVVTPGPNAASSPATAGTVAVPAVALTEVYRVGVGDVLDIQLPGMPTSESTLFTVMEGGLLDYPLAREAVRVSELTTSEIAAILRQRIKLFEDPEVVVGVRDYASHTIVINGFVAAPGRKALRREAMPLFVVLAEAQQLPEATQVTIIRSGSLPLTVNLADKEASSTLVFPGDVINIGGAPVEPLFFFIGGRITSPGQKPYHAGLTLTQAILASGGVTNSGNIVRLSRQGSDGRLTTTEYNLKEIFDGRLADPPVEQGDRLEVSEGQ